MTRDNLINSKCMSLDLGRCLFTGWHGCNFNSKQGGVCQADLRPVDPMRLTRQYLADATIGWRSSRSKREIVLPTHWQGVYKKNIVHGLNQNIKSRLSRICFANVSPFSELVQCLGVYYHFIGHFICCFLTSCHSSINCPTLYMFHAQISLTICA